MHRAGVPLAGLLAAPAGDGVGSAHRRQLAERLPAGAQGRPPQREGRAAHLLHRRYLVSLARYEACARPHARP